MAGMFVHLGQIDQMLERLAKQPPDERNDWWRAKVDKLLDARILATEPATPRD